MCGVLSTTGNEPVHVDGACCWYLIIMSGKINILEYALV